MYTQDLVSSNLLDNDLIGCLFIPYLLSTIIIVVYDKRLKMGGS